MVTGNRFEGIGLTAYRLKGVTLMRSSIAKFCFLFRRAWRLNVLTSALSLFLGTTVLAQDTEQAEAANDVVAVVNADPITRSMLSDATVRRFGGEILENMVNRSL